MIVPMGYTDGLSVLVEFPDGPKYVEAHYDGRNMLVPDAMDGWEFVTVIGGDVYAYQTMREEYPEPDRDWKGYAP